MRLTLFKTHDLYENFIISSLIMEKWSEFLSENMAKKDGNLLMINWKKKKTIVEIEDENC